MTNLLWILIIIFPLFGFWNYGLFDLDEGFYAAVTAEMIKSKNYIIPTYQGIPWFEKPILLYWITSGSIYFSLLYSCWLPYIFPLPFFIYYIRQKFKKTKINLNSLINVIIPLLIYLFYIKQISAQPYLLNLSFFRDNFYNFTRLSEFSVRLPSFLATLGLYGSIYYWIKKWTNSNRALITTLICSTSIFTVAIGKLMLTDALYTALLTHALLSYYHAITYNPKSKVWTGIFLGFAMLAKGPVAPFLFGIIVIISHLLNPGLHKKGYEFLSIIAFFSIIGLWYIPVYLTMPETFWTEFIINQNIQRFLGGDKAHKVNNILLSLFYYVPLLFVALFPWTFKLKKAFQNSSPLSKYIKIWIITIFVFFTLSQSKLPHYIFPCIPPLTILLSLQLPEVNLKSKKFLLTRAFHAIIMFGITQIFFILWYTKFHPEEMITRQVVTDLDQFYIPGEKKDHPLYTYYWYDSKELKKNIFGLSLTSHPSATFYKFFGHYPLCHKYLQDQPIFNITDFDSLKSPCVLITRGKITSDLSTYLKTYRIKSYSYCYPDTKNPYITLYIVNSKKESSSIINTHVP